MSDFAERLVDRGLSGAEASSKAGLLQRASGVIGAARGTAQAPFTAFVPGRIEVLGKHTDYAGGRSLLCAAERGICLVASPRADSLVRITDVVSNETVEAVLGRVGQVGPAGQARRAEGRAVDRARRRAGGWGVYVWTVARRLARNFPEARRGADIAFGSDLPMAAGMSSSSALVTSVLLALVAMNDLGDTERYRANVAIREDLAEYLGTIENGQDFRGLRGDAGVGTFGGSEDHTAMLCCRAGELSQYSFCPVRHERQIPLPEEYSFVVGVSGVVAEKTGAARETYNRASLAARRVLSLWNQATGRRDATLGAAVQSAPSAADRIRDILAAAEPSLRPRFDQFVEETFEIIPAVGDRLLAGRADEISGLVDRSQAAGERGLRNQVPETILLAGSARALGAVAASAFGAGFGGSVWALTKSEQTHHFPARWREAYTAAFPQHAGRCEFFSTRPGPAAITI